MRVKTSAETRSVGYTGLRKQGRLAVISTASSDAPKLALRKGLGETVDGTSAQCTRGHILGVKTIPVLTSRQRPFMRSSEEAGTRISSS